MIKEKIKGTLYNKNVFSNAEFLMKNNMQFSYYINALFVTACYDF